MTAAIKIKDSKESMSNKDRTALYHALIDGKICEVTHKGGTSRVRLNLVSTNGISLQFWANNNCWQSFSLHQEHWYSWREYIEPRVWEGETRVFRNSLGEPSIYVDGLIPGTSVRYRLEEITEAKS